MAEKARSKKHDESIKMDFGMGHLGMGGLFKAFKTWWTSYPSWKKQAAK